MNALYANIPVTDHTTHTYKGVKIVITWQADHYGDFGGFYGWRVGDHEEAPCSRHSFMAYDAARAFINNQ